MMSFEYDYFGYETLPNHTGKYYCHVLQVCKETYETVHHAVELQLQKELQKELRFYREEVMEEWEEVHNVSSLKKFVKEYNEYFDYMVVFKNVLVNEWDGTRRYCMLRPLG